MYFQLLGPLEVSDHASPVALGGGKRRAVLALLLLHPNEVVPAERLIDALWGERPPATSAKALQVHVSQLRRDLHGVGAAGNGGALVTRSGGYLLQLGRDDLDVHRFERALADGEQALSAGDPRRAAERLRSGLALWRGPALADFTYEPFAQDAIARLEELRLAAIEQRMEADLALGRHAHVVGELEALVRGHPLRERVRGLLMLALYRCGRQAEALETYRDGRRKLVEELGIEPGPELRELHAKVLQQSPSLAGPASAPAAGRTPVVPGNLPADATSFVGRERELRELRTLLPGERLVTVHGAGGSGKTRLALRAAAEAAADFEHGAWLVELAPVADPAVVWQAVAAALGVHDEPGRTLGESVRDGLSGRALLLVLDNCEHVLDAARTVAHDLLAACPRLHVLATSRERLADPSELVWRIPELSSPAADEALAVDAMLEHDAVRLFVERAGRSLPGYRLREADCAALTRICRDLDGMPLAIELAAARLDVLSPEQIAERLTDRFRLLTRADRAAPARHRTLRATVDWSYALLSEAEQEALARASAFAGGFDLDAAEQVLAAGVIAPEQVLDLIASLAGKSLLARHEEHGRARYGLHETIKEYAAARLAETGDVDAVRDRHLDWCAALLERADEELRGPDQAHWARRLAPDQDNFRQALAWALSHGRAQRALEVAGHLHVFWGMLGKLVETERWLGAAIAATAGAPATVERCRALCRWAELAECRGDFAEARARYAPALEMGRSLGDPIRHGVCLLSLGTMDLEQGRVADARRSFEAADELMRDAGDPERARWPVQELGRVALAAGDTVAARARFEACRDAARALGVELGVAEATLLLGVVAHHEGDHAAAQGLYRQSVGCARRCSDRELEARCELAIGRLAVDTGAEQDAARALGTALRFFHDAALRPAVPGCLEALAAVALARGEAVAAVRLLGASAAFRELLGTVAYPPDGERAARTLTATRRALGESAFASAHREGRALGWSEAVERALAVTA